MIFAETKIGSPMNSIKNSCFWPPNGSSETERNFFSWNKGEVEGSMGSSSKQRSGLVGTGSWLSSIPALEVAKTAMAFSGREKTRLLKGPKSRKVKKPQGDWLSHRICSEIWQAKRLCKCLQRSLTWNVTYLHSTYVVFISSCCVDLLWSFGTMNQLPIRNIPTSSQPPFSIGVLGSWWSGHKPSCQMGAFMWWNQPGVWRIRYSCFTMVHVVILHFRCSMLFSKNVGNRCCFASGCRKKMPKLNLSTMSASWTACFAPVQWPKGAKLLENWWIGCTRQSFTWETIEINFNCATSSVRRCGEDSSANCATYPVADHICCAHGNSSRVQRFLGISWTHGVSECNAFWNRIIYIYIHVYIYIYGHVMSHKHGPMKKYGRSLVGLSQQSVA